MPLPSLARIVRALRRQHGALRASPPRSAFEWVLWENCAYLANDDKRARAFALLKRTVGLSPKAIEQAPMAKLLAVTRHGIVAPLFARKLRLSAEIALGDFDGDVDATLSSDPVKAARQLRRFPGIGAPSAERMLVASGRLRALPLDSNALRVLQRIGFGKSLKSYSATYRSVQAAVPIGRMPAKSLFSATLLLRRHGQTICRTSSPRCGACKLQAMCAFRSRALPR
jgi:endonuclease-3